MNWLEKNKIVLISFLILIVVWFVFPKKTIQPPQNPDTFQPKEQKQPAPKTESESQSPINSRSLPSITPDWKENIQKRFSPVVTDPSPFCIGKDQKQFYLPREVGLRITKYKTSFFFLSKAFVSCLKPGAFQFIISEYDNIGRINYRSFLKFKADIVEISDARAGDIDFQSWAALSKVPIDQYVKGNIVKIVLTQPSYSETYFNFDTLTEHNTVIKPIPKDQKKIYSDTAYIYNRIFPISHPAIADIFRKISENENIFYLTNKFDVSGFNLAQAYFVKFRKIPTVIKDTSSESSQTVHKNLVDADEQLFRDSKTLVIDLRPTHSAQFLKLRQAVSIPINLRGAGTPWEIINRLKMDWRLSVKVTEAFKNKFKTEESLWMRKTLVIVSTDHDDPLVRLFYDAMDKRKDYRTKVIKGGVYQLALEQYFFGRKYFEDLPELETNPAWQSLLMMGR